MQIQDITPLKKFWNFTEALVLHRNVANMIYFGRIEETEVVLRLTPILQRTSEEIFAELQWMNELSQKNFPVPELIPSTSGQLFESLTINGNEFHAMVMVKIEGVRVDDKLMSDEIILLWSDLLAGLQKHSKPANSGLKRMHWNEDYIYKSSLPEIPRSTEEVQKLFNDLIIFLDHYPKDQYGLIHGDLHTGNFFYKDQGLIVFDFDDSCYHFFLYDLTVPILSIYKWMEKPEQLEKRDHYINLFLKNYFKTISRPKNFKDDFKKFIQFRSILVASWLKIIRKEREMSEKMNQQFDEAIFQDMHIAFHPEIFDFIES